MDKMTEQDKELLLLDLEKDRKYYQEKLSEYNESSMVTAILVDNIERIRRIINTIREVVIQ